MKSTKYTINYTFIGMCLGLAIGCWLDQFIVGIVIGTMIGLWLGRKEDKKINAQLQSDGWEIVAIGPMITIENKAKEKKQVGSIQNVKVGDIVYLSENGIIHKV